jgi:methyl-accepting chemotaxis protein
MKTVYDAYKFIEQMFFFTLTRKIVGNMLFLFGCHLLFLWLAHGALPASGSSGFWIAVLLGSLLFGFSTFYLCFLIVRPVQTILDRLNAINSHQGDLSMRLPAFTHDEFHLLSDAYNQFVEELSALLHGVSATAERANVSNQAVTNALTNVLARTDAQARLTNGIGEASSAVTAAMSEIRGAVGSVAHATEANCDAAKISSRQLGVAVKDIAAIGDLLAEFVDTVSGLQENADNIRKILQMVEEFSDQTNLLALNAAIEAARAGDAGRGFSVVADEVRSLAAKVNSATQKIHEFINAMDQLVAQSHAESATLDARSRQARNTINAADETFQHMLDDFQSNTHLLNQVDASVRDLAERYRQIDTSVNQIAALGQAISSDMHALKQQSAILSDDTAATQKKLSLFKTST